MGKKVSIIIPVYCTEQYLEKCIESILGQTYINIEIILVDDGSKDNSLKICEVYKEIDKRVILISKTNGGISSARNTGLNICSGDYILFVDSDDWIEASCIEQMVYFMEKKRVDSVWCNRKDDIGDISNVSRYKKSSGLYEKNLILKNFLCNEKNFISGAVHTKLYKKEFIMDIIRFKEDINFDEDFAFNIEYLLKANNIYISNETCLYHYRKNPNSITNNYRKDMWEFKLRLYKHLNEIIYDECGEVFLKYLKTKIIVGYVKSVYNEYCYKSYKQAIPFVKTMHRNIKSMNMLECYWLGFRFRDLFFVFLLVHKLYFLSYIAMKSPQIFTNFKRESKVD